MKARDVMTPNPITVTPEATLAEVWDLMREADIRHVPVVQAGILVGMVCDRDLASFDVARVLTTDGAEAACVARANTRPGRPRDGVASHAAHRDRAPVHCRVPVRP
jgi:signal-transduction protein with cAMP-binding, CBS, and nucleotidyltransferase domain